MSHELKTLLTCIIGATERFAKNSLNAEQKNKLLEMLFEQSHRLNLRCGYSAWRHRKTTCSGAILQRCPAGVLAGQSACADKAAARGISCISRTGPLQIAGDCQLLEQAVANLINNAILYSNSPEIDVSLIREQDFAVITVRDYGIGIAPEHQERIFERFYRVHKERSRQLGGTGLGLAIVKHVAQLHHGHAELQTPPEKAALSGLFAVGIISLLGVSTWRN